MINTILSLRIIHSPINLHPGVDIHLPVLIFRFSHHNLGLIPKFLCHKRKSAGIRETIPAAAAEKVLGIFGIPAVISCGCGREGKRCSRIAAVFQIIVAGTEIRCPTLLLFQRLIDPFLCHLLCLFPHSDLVQTLFINGAQTNPRVFYHPSITAEVPLIAAKLYPFVFLHNARFRKIVRIASNLFQSLCRLAVHIVVSAFSYAAPSVFRRCCMDIAHTRIHAPRLNL